VIGPGAEVYFILGCERPETSVMEPQRGPRRGQAKRKAVDENSHAAAHGGSRVAKKSRTRGRALPAALASKPVVDWTMTEVSKALQSQGLGHHVKSFRAAGVDGARLVDRATGLVRGLDEASTQPRGSDELYRLVGLDIEGPPSTEAGTETGHVPEEYAADVRKVCEVVARASRGKDEPETNLETAPAAAVAAAAAAATPSPSDTAWSDRTLQWAVLAVWVAVGVPWSLVLRSTLVEIEYADDTAEVFGVIYFCVNVLVLSLSFCLCLLFPETWCTRVAFPTMCLNCAVYTTTRTLCAVPTDALGDNSLLGGDGTLCTALGLAVRSVWRVSIGHSIGPVLVMVVTPTFLVIAQIAARHYHFQAKHDQPLPAWASTRLSLAEALSAAWRDGDDADSDAARWLWHGTFATTPNPVEGGKPRPSE